MSAVKVKDGEVWEVYLGGEAVMEGMGVLQGMGVPPVYAGLLALARVPLKAPITARE